MNVRYRKHTASTVLYFYINEKTIIGVEYTSDKKNNIDFTDWKGTWREEILYIKHENNKGRIEEFKEKLPSNPYKEIVRYIWGENESKILHYVIT